MVSANSTAALLQQPWFLILVAMQAIERLTGLASGVAFERDWVVLVGSII
jgi:iron-regulated transporter 1